MHSDRSVTLGYDLKDGTLVGQLKTEVAALFGIDVGNIRMVRDWKVGQVDVHEEAL